MSELLADQLANNAGRSALGVSRCPPLCREIVVVAPEQGPLQARLCEAIAFCEAWHQRLGRGEEPDADSIPERPDKKAVQTLNDVGDLFQPGGAETKTSRALSGE